MITDGAAVVALSTVADDAGALLVRSGLVSTSALDAARAAMAGGGGTIGEQLVALGAIADDALTDFYRQRLLVPQVNPNTLARLPARVVSVIPADVAIELRVIPVSLDGDNNLTVAMSDPSDRKAVDELAFVTGSYVVRAVATQMQIAWCLAHYYGHVTPLGQRLLQPSEPAPAPAPVPASSGQIPRVKGLTGEINAQRKRGIVPMTGPVQLQRQPSAARVEDSDGVPAASPRAHSISGEIRVQHPRAQSIRPALPPEESGPTISVEVNDDSQPEIVIQRRRAVKSDPPELAARAGEVDIATGPIRKVDLDEPRVVIEEEAAAPTMIVEDEASGGVVIHEALHREISEPVLLDRKRPSQPPPEPEEVVELVSPKARAPRTAKNTQVGVGIVTAQTAPRTHRDTDVSSDPTHDSIPVPVGASTDTVRTATRPIEYDPVDDGWGPPGTTIPPPLLGAMPGSDQLAPGGMIPIASVDSAPLMIAAPVTVAPDTSAGSLARALEDAMHRALELIRSLERAPDRDTVVRLVIEHLVETHQRAGFFSVRPGPTKAPELGVFAIKPSTGSTPFATLPLDRPSTLQDVVGTRLPYRGPMHDDASRGFLATVLGASPSEILLVPVAIRERVVGVLFGEQRLRHTFDDQLALVARAAGLALERIMKTKRA